MPEWAQINIIEPSPHDAATAYVAATCYKSDDTRPYLFRTTDYGATWTKITDGIPDEEFTRVIREDPARRGLLYCGTERGIHVSFDDGGSWQRLESNLPITPIWDLVVKDTDLVVATHGRAFWILDDVTPLRQLQADIVHTPAHVFKPRDTIRFRLYGRGEAKSTTHLNYKMTGPVTVAFKRVELPNGQTVDQFIDAGRNPPEGVILHYWLRDKPESVGVCIVDADGNEVRSYSSKREKNADSDEAPSEEEVQQVSGEEEVGEEAEAGAGPWASGEAGMNRLVWDYRYEKPVKLDKKSRNAREEALEAVGGPRAVPGQYAVRLTVGDQTVSETFSLLADPRLPVSMADLRAQFELKMAIRDRTSETHTAINQIRRVREQVEEWEKRASEHAAVKDAARTLKDALKAIEGQLINLDFENPRPGLNRIKEKWDALSSMIDESDDAPTQGATQVYEALNAALQEQRRALSEVMEGPVKSFSDLVRSQDVPPIAV
jgi:hypothetical protein